MSANQLFENFVNEEMRWNELLKTIISSNAELVSVSPYNYYSRTYKSGNRILKIRKLSDGDYSNSLTHEYEILTYLQHRSKEFDFDPVYKVINGYETLAIKFKKGILLERLLELKSVRLVDLFKIFWLIFKLNSHGVVHRDLTSTNILVSKEGISLIDFDQARKTTPLFALISDFLGIGPQSIKAIHPIRRLAIRVIGYKFPVLKKKVVNKKVNQATLVADEIIDYFDKKELLRKAWHIATYSDANSPGANKAYYSINLCGDYYPGERPWPQRWKAINKSVDFTGKRVLELGCNMGLLSVFAKLSGALDCVGLDIDEKIISSAHLLAQAFDVDNQYFQQNFDDMNNWEGRYQNFDIVIALSVLNWLSNKEKFLKFLGNFNELLYEGHDEFQIEYDRLTACGFSRIEIVAISERDRIIFHCYK